MPSRVPSHQSAQASDGEDTYDVLVVGAGLAGTSLAAGLARLDHRVLLVAATDRHPREFRAEKFAEGEMAILDSYGLGQAARATATLMQTCTEGRWGRLVSCVPAREYAMRYPELVDALRGALPAGAEAVVGRIDTVSAGAQRQEIVLSDGRRYAGRLLVVATGFGDALHRQLGLTRSVTSQAHTLVYGFDVPPGSLALGGDQIVWHGERTRDRVAYLTVFPIGDTLRANFFTYWKREDAAAAAFAADPAASLARLLPNLVASRGAVVPSGPVKMRPVDLIATPNPLRDGVVLVGDAFCTTCPTFGTGVRKALSDVETLVRLVPGWLATPGMSASKIASFYADPAKAALDAETVGKSLRLRRMIVDPSLAARFLYTRSYLYRRGLLAVRDVSTRLAWRRPAQA